MEVSPTENTEPTTRSGFAAQTLGGNFETFVTLLTTQLQHQDPLDPMDSSEFTKQLVSYSQVEQAIQTNQNLEELIQTTSTAATAESFSALVSYLGKDVTMDTNVSGMQDGEAEWHYTLDSDAETVEIIIQDENGKEIYKTTGDKSIGAQNKGDHVFVWDGIDEYGNEAPEGSYAMSVTAKNDKRAAVNSTITVRGRVERAETELGFHSLIVNGAKLPLGSLINVTEPKVTEPAAENS